MDEYFGSLEEEQDTEGRDNDRLDPLSDEWERENSMQQFIDALDQIQKEALLQLQNENEYWTVTNA